MYENIIAVPFRNRNVHLEYFIKKYGSVTSRTFTK